MARGVAITPEEYLAYHRLRADGASRAAAARRINISYESAKRFDAEGRDTAVANARIAWQRWDDEQAKIEARKVRQRGHLSANADAALDDIDLFARRYFGIILRPWQLEASAKVVELYHTAEEEYLVVNVAPGSGKTTFFTKILPAWVTARDRSVRGLIGSNVQRVADSMVRQLRREFEREIPIKAEPREMQMGLAVDAVATLAGDYGAFRPDNAELWRADTFVVRQPGDESLADKEPTWSAFGRNTGFLGLRFDMIVWDDVYDRTAMRTAEARAELRRWWDDIAETRLEPGGLLVLQGQRLSAEDIYRYALDKVKVVEIDDDEGTEEVVGKKYHHIKFVAHDEENCQKLHKRTDPALGAGGCLLDPRRLPYSKLKGIQQHDPRQFAVVYQQEDVDFTHTLVNPLWVSGGTSPEGILYPGCWDNDRDIWELPANIPSGGITVASADPSPTKFWALQAWHYVPDTGFRYLLEAYRQQMDAPSFLDWNHAQGRFSGIAEEWWQISSDMGRPITYWIVEANAAQKFILQYDHFRRWAALRGVQLLAHYTHARNKTDPDYGVWMLAQHWRDGRIRLPGKPDTYARPHSLLLINEVTKWTPEREHLMTDDCVMAQWFFEHNLPNLRPPNTAPTELRRPSWIKKPRSLVR